MAKIDPITFPLDQGVATDLNVLILNFSSEATNCTVQYTLISDSGKTLLRGEYRLTEQEYADWGADNTWVEQCVANAIGVTITTF